MPCVVWNAHNKEQNNHPGLIGGGGHATELWEVILNTSHNMNGWNDNLKETEGLNMLQTHICQTAERKTSNEVAYSSLYM